MTAVSGRGRTLALVAALLGWMFDGMEMGLFPLVARPALGELLGLAPGEGKVATWYGIVTAAFLIGAATGGVVVVRVVVEVGPVGAVTVGGRGESVCWRVGAASA